MQNTVKERLIEFIKYKGISVRSFCRGIGVSETYVSSIRKSMQPDKIHLIMVKYPELNFSWILTGEGTMIRDIYSPDAKSPEREALVAYASEAFKDKLIEMFKSGEIYSAEIVREKDKIINHLLIQNDRLELENNELKKRIENNNGAK